MSCFPFGLLLQIYEKISRIKRKHDKFLKKRSKKFVCSEKSRILALDMTSHASHRNSAPGEVFEFFKPNVMMAFNEVLLKELKIFP